MSQPQTIKIDEVEYVRKDTIKKDAEKVDGMPLVLIRTYSAGVHYGYLAEKKSTLAGVEVTLKNARRIWSWQGAASLSQLAMEGVKGTTNSKITMPVHKIELVAIEIILMTDDAKENLSKVKEWKI